MANSCHQVSAVARARLSAYHVNGYNAYAKYKQQAPMPPNLQNIANRLNGSGPGNFVMGLWAVGIHNGGGVMLLYVAHEARGY